MDRTTEIGEFSKALKKKGLKATHERTLIWEEVRRYKEHFNADELFSVLRKRDKRIARDTVYRTLPILLECGLLQKSVGGGRREYYERTEGKGHHDHMVCISCRKVIEFHSEDIEKAQERSCEKYNFKMVFHDHRLFGFCSDCR